MKFCRGCANETSTAPNNPFLPVGKDPTTTPCAKDGHQKLQLSPLSGIRGLSSKYGVADLYCCSKDVCNSASILKISVVIVAISIVLCRASMGY